ncbi:deec0651-859f-4de2-85af-7c522228b301 [Thermothielavioides terrestris]|uniref:Protein AF-9 homolog n=2 Tax=Thermothielavioides terrestris TaxID=2587410 RepID=G2RBN3_THETT|nr:YAF9-like protein [Thermothielavioides terrestris NRRL 8126]AEO69204.1 YAF9-like protein [Thermothielavioides terrestris NRRL 8126]SPQ22518.1 deec0651-859f-4de2-85af-7c522228b301 [Thermothielavioides terrestris]
MAPAAGKRVKGVQIFRPFVYGTTARPFDEKTNPKPPGIPDDHTHSWTVFVKGIDDVDITYWLRRVQFKLHESIPNHIRMIEGEKGKPFELHETGWGEFEIAIKLYYAPESAEKPQTLYHHLRLHPYGRTEEEKEAMRLNGGQVISWAYEEQLFNEPYEPFYELLTSGAMPPAAPPPPKSSGSKSSSSGGGSKGKEKDAGKQVVASRTEGGVLERSAMIPLTNRPGQPFSRETEQVEIKKLKEALVKVEALMAKTKEEVQAKEKRLKELKMEAAKG